MDDAETMELAEIDVARLIEVMHRQGLNFHQILRIFQDACNGIEVKAEAENHLKGGK